MVVKRLFSFWDDNFSGDMGYVTLGSVLQNTIVGYVIVSWWVYRRICIDSLGEARNMFPNRHCPCQVDSQTRTKKAAHRDRVSQPSGKKASLTGRWSVDKPHALLGELAHHDLQVKGMDCCSFVWGWTSPPLSYWAPGSLIYFRLVGLGQQPDWSPDIGMVWQFDIASFGNVWVHTVSSKKHIKRQ